MHGIYKQPNLPYLNVKLCPNCQQLQPLDVTVCANCEYSFIEKTVESTKQTETNNDYKDINTYSSEQNINAQQLMQQEEKEEVKPPLKGKFIFCDNCGEKIIGSQKYCGSCGAKVSKRICPKCDEIVDSHLAFCPLCGEKLIENNNAGNVSSVNTPVTNQPISATSYNGQPINIYLNPNAVPTSQPEAVIPPLPTNNEENNEVKVDPKTESIVTNELMPTEELLTFDGVNMGRKRLFVIIQFLIVALIAAIMIVVPILTSESFVKVVFDCFKGETSESLITGKGIVDFVLEAIKNKGLISDKTSLMYPLITNNSNHIFTSISFIGKACELVSKDPEMLSYKVSLFVVLGVYALITLAILLVLIVSIFSFISKRPFRGRTLGVLVIALLIGCIFVYTSTFTEEFAHYDSWLLYAFAISFFLWFIIKLVFLKETRLYEKHQEYMDSIGDKDL